MKILNLYAGIGGNRKLWGNEHEITAVEYEPNIAAIYKDFFPGDEIVIADAHEFLLKNFSKLNDYKYLNLFGDVLVITSALYLFIRGSIIF